MAYTLSEVTIRTDNSPAGVACINELWKDIESGKLPILFDSEHQPRQGISPVSRYSGYEDGERGKYDLTVMGVTADFFARMEQEVEKGAYKKYDESDEKGDISACTGRAWEKVWAEQGWGSVKRAFTVDYESAVPAEYTKDGKAHCYLYIAVEAE